MVGIVLWSDAPGLRLLIWCEDQGGLAYYDGSRERPIPDASAGDVVQVEEVPGTGPMRRARAVQLVAQGAAAQVPQMLLREAARHGAALAKI
ncbi:hypothetical protein RA2_00240 [Roseovarius sp. A-2]|uniref:hypothetical protein n=1 Tax=Roseovarius sp. A-2 TaxID=1570360 RepID=UPI0009B50FC6|nr:hypothetical protein [Roseovarius sp. A-2]GAW33204.1 hypothetical protein RA2_00240 [Roseovarius sp. A-2]